MDHHVGIGNQRVDGVTVEDVALPVFGFSPAPRRWIERSTGHADDALHLGMLVQRIDRRSTDFAGGPRDGNRQRHARVVPRRAESETPEPQAMSASACFAAL
jgi:hypothetical protein